MEQAMNRKIVLENGSVYEGYAFGAEVDRVCEIAFNTAMVGYQEMVSDPSCTDTAVVMTYPIIGNYGITDDDYETRVPTLGALIVREINENPSNFRYTKTLSELLSDNGIPGICGLDTRKLTREIRNQGSQKVLITSIDRPHDECLRILAETEIPMDAVSRVSCKKRWYSRTSNHKFNIVAVDCGIKLNAVRVLNAKGCNVTIVPWNTPAEEIDFMRPDGVLVSSGPGNPEYVPEVIDTVRRLRGKYPIFGIGLGHQIIALAFGAKIDKMKFGHHGGNHPVRNLLTNRIEITSQGTSYTVNADSLRDTALTLTHVNLLDGAVEGVACPKDRVLSVQFHPESAPGPHDSDYLFDQFIDMLKEAR